MDFSLYYFLPWPLCQEVQNTAPREYWSYTDPDMETGIFVEKEWLDNNRKEYGF